MHPYLKSVRLLRGGSLIPLQITVVSIQRQEQCKFQEGFSSVTLNSPGLPLPAALLLASFPRLSSAERHKFVPSCLQRPGFQSLWVNAAVWTAPRTDELFAGGCRAAGFWRLLRPVSCQPMMLRGGVPLPCYEKHKFLLCRAALQGNGDVRGSCSAAVQAAARGSAPRRQRITRGIAPSLCRSRSAPALPPAETGAACDGVVGACAWFSG